MIFNLSGGNGDFNVALVGTEQTFRKGQTTVSMGEKQYTLAPGNLCSVEHISHPSGMISNPGMLSIGITVNQWTEKVEKVSEGVYVFSSIANNQYQMQAVKENDSAWTFGTITTVGAGTPVGSPMPGPFRVAENEFLMGLYRSATVYWYRVETDLSITLLGTFTMPKAPRSQYFKFYKLQEDSSGRVTKVACAGMAYCGTLNHGSKTIAFSAGTNLNDSMGFATWGIEGTKHHVLGLIDSGSASCIFKRLTFDYGTGIVTDQGEISIEWNDDKTGGSTSYGSQPRPFAFRIEDRMLLMITGTLGNARYYNKYLIRSCDGTEAGLKNLRVSTEYSQWNTYSTDVSVYESLITNHSDCIGESGDTNFALAPAGPVISLNSSAMVVTKLSNDFPSTQLYNWDYGMIVREGNPKVYGYETYLGKMQLRNGAVECLVGYTSGDNYDQVNPYINEPTSGYEKYSKLCGVVVDISDVVTVLVPTNM